jgi:hypothetical protein
MAAVSVSLSEIGGISGSGWFPGRCIPLYIPFSCRFLFSQLHQGFT